MHLPRKILSLKLRWGNFSEKPPSHILGWGRDVMDGGSGEGQRLQGGLGDRGLSCCNAEFDYTAYPDYWPEPCSSGEGPGQREDQGSGKGGPNLKPLSERATPTVEEVSCTRCSRRVCRSCGTPLPQGNSHPQPHLTPTGQAKVSSGVPSSSSVASSGRSYAAVAKGPCQCFPY